MNIGLVSNNIVLTRSNLISDTDQSFNNALAVDEVLTGSITLSTYYFPADPVYSGTTVIPYKNGIRAKVPIYQGFVNLDQDVIGSLPYGEFTFASAGVYEPLLFFDISATTTGITVRGVGSPDSTYDITVYIFKNKQDNANNNVIERS